MVASSGGGEVAQDDWASWLGERMAHVGFVSNSDLARASGVPDSAISRWRTSGTMPSLGQLRRLVEPLQAPLLELLVAAGHLTAEEAQLREIAPPVRQPRGTRDAISIDPDLSEDLKHLLLLQYEAMRALARARRSGNAETADGSG